MYQSVFTSDALLLCLWCWARAQDSTHAKQTWPPSRSPTPYLSCVLELYVLLLFHVLFWFWDSISCSLGWPPTLRGKQSWIPNPPASTSQRPDSRHVLLCPSLSCVKNQLGVVIIAACSFLLLQTNLHSISLQLYLCLQPYFFRISYST